VSSTKRGERIMPKHVTIADIMSWRFPYGWGGVDDGDRSVTGALMEDLADTIADLLNGNYTIAQLRNAILSHKEERG